MRKLLFISLCSLFLMSCTSVWSPTQIARIFDTSPYKVYHAQPITLDPAPAPEADNEFEKVQQRIQSLNPDLDPSLAGKYSRLFIKHSRMYNLDVNMVVHVAFIESCFDEQAVSRTGDYGLMQINWSAHKRALRKMGIDRQELLDPKVNINYGCKLLSAFAQRSRSLFGIIKRYSPAKPRYYTRKLERLMSQSNI